jgi:hypothetical protein
VRSRREDEGEDNSPEIPWGGERGGTLRDCKEYRQSPFSLNYWFHSRFRDFKKSVEVAKNQNKRSRYSLPA